jgi:hypothetical protein
MRRLLMPVRIRRPKIKLVRAALRFPGEGRRRDVTVHIAIELAASTIWRTIIALSILARCAIAPGAATTTATATATRTSRALATLALRSVKALAIAVTISRTRCVIRTWFLSSLACRIARWLVTARFIAPRPVVA